MANDAQAPTLTDAFDEVEGLVGECAHRNTDGVCELCVSAALARARAEEREAAIERCRGVHCFCQHIEDAIRERGQK